MKHRATGPKKCGESISMWCFIKRGLFKLIRLLVKVEKTSTEDTVNYGELRAVVRAERLYGSLAGYHSCPDCGGTKALFWIFRYIPFPKNPRRLRRVDTKNITCKECGKHGSYKTFDFHCIPH